MTFPRRSRVQLTPRPRGKSDEEDDWGDWTNQARRKDPPRRGHDDQRRPRSPPAVPGRNSTSPSSRADHQLHAARLIPLRVCKPSTSLGSHVFVLRSDYEVEEVAIRMSDVQYYKLPSIAALVYPEPSRWKQSWEAVYRSLMPHRASIIQDEFAAGPDHGLQQCSRTSPVSSTFRCLT